jgi:hypothetical protein
MNMKAKNEGWIAKLLAFFKAKKTRSAESKAKQSEGMKKAWARRRAVKEGLLIIKEG